MVRILIWTLLLFCGCYTIPPQEPIVVITFDDGDPSIYSRAFPIMKEIDPTFSATHFLCNDYGAGAEVVTIEQLREMEAAGWETGGHGRNHENFSSLTGDSVQEQVQSSYEFLVQNGLSHESFAYPFGNFNDSTQYIVARYFKNIRNSHDYRYSQGVNRRSLGYFAVKSGHRTSDLISRVEEARRGREPLVIIGFHLILPDDHESVPVYWCRESVYREFLLYLQNQELNVLTLREAMQLLDP